MIIIWLTIFYISYFFWLMLINYFTIIKLNEWFKNCKDPQAERLVCEGKSEVHRPFCEGVHLPSLIYLPTLFLT